VKFRYPEERGVGIQVPVPGLKSYGFVHSDGEGRNFYFGHFSSRKNLQS
jgi:hypothetical protein